MKEASLINDVAQLCTDMQKSFDPNEFFKRLMKIYGTANSSIERCLDENANFNVAKKEQIPGTLRPDLAIPRRVYVRFLERDEDVREAVDAIKESSEFKNSKAKLEFIICASQHLMSVYDAVADDTDSFDLSELPSHFSTLLPLTGSYERAFGDEGKDADVRACKKITRLLDDLIACNKLDPGKDGSLHEIHDFIRRVLFCLFAEDTGIFEQDQFSKACSKLIDKQGTNAKQFFLDLFEALDTPPQQRSLMGRPLSKEILDFPYVNGGLFKDAVYVPSFNLATRNQLLDCGRLKWHEISPAIFGAMFQSALDPKLRRELGAHYTSEENILKIVNPLFMDNLNAEFDEICAKPAQTTKDLKKLRDDLFDFQTKLSSLKFLDPACGCGNFLIIAYRELRRLENRVIEKLFEYGFYSDEFLNIADVIKVRIDQFYGIEIEDWPSEIAHLSMWLMQHMMNKETAKKFGRAVPSIPLKSSATIVCANALTADWNEVLKAPECSYILGNPPFGGTTNTTSEQKEWLRLVYPPKTKIGRVDYVSAWFVKSSDYMAGNKNIEAGLVATNSICQGAQVELLWDLLLKRGIKINFAYPTFTWKNAAGKSAAVMCVIVGFSYVNHVDKYLLTMRDGVVNKTKVMALSPYLLPVNLKNVVKSRSNSINASKNLQFGNMPVDGGNLILDKNERDKIIEQYPEAKKFIKFFVGSDEIINGKFRYCLWLKEEDRGEWEKIPPIVKHVEACRKFRESSVKTGDAYKYRGKPWSFREQKNPKSTVVIPRVSSERRFYVPMNFVDERTIVNDSCFMLPDTTAYEFGILVSRMHMCWMRLTSGRLKSDYRYARDLTYNTFVWPEVTEEQSKAIGLQTWELLKMRAQKMNNMSLAELYNPETMPDDLKEAHAKLDEAVERLYRDKPFESDEERTMFMLSLYEKAVADEEK